MRAAEKYFAGLPAAVRTRFDNDVINFMSYLESGASDEDLRDLGLEVLGDRRGRAQDGREGDALPTVDIAAGALAAADATGAAGTVPT